MFADLGAFVEAHQRRAGDFVADVGEQADGGYRVCIACAVTTEIAAQDLIGSRLLTSERWPRRS